MAGSGGIQTTVAVTQAPAVAGDWSSANPRTFFTSGPGGLVAGPSGLTVGLFAWLAWSGAADTDSAPIIAQNYFGGVPIGASGFGGAGGAAPSGFVHREQQGLNTTYLLDASQTIPVGFPIALCSSGDVWVKNDGSAAAYLGYQAFADFATGKISFLAAGSAATTVTCATSTITAATSVSATGGISGNLMTLTAANNTIYNGMKVTVGAATGTVVVSQVTPLLTGETTGGIGRYYVSIPEQSVAAGTSLTIAGYVLTLGGGSPATPSGTFKVGAYYTYSTTNAGYITQSVSGSGGTASGDVLAVLPVTGTTLSSNTVTATTNVATKWYAQSSGAAGELIKMSSHALG